MKRGPPPSPRLGIDVDVGAVIVSALGFAIAGALLLLLPLLFGAGPSVNVTCDLRDPGVPRALAAAIIFVALGFVEGWTYALGAATRAGACAAF